MKNCHCNNIKVENLLRNFIIDQMYFHNIVIVPLHFILHYPIEYSLKKFPLIFIVFVYSIMSRLYTMALVFLCTKYTQTVVLFPALQYLPTGASLTPPILWCHLRAVLSPYTCIFPFYSLIPNLYSLLHLWTYKRSTCLCDSGCWVSGLLFEFSFTRSFLF